MAPAAGEPLPIDYTVFSVTVLTLWLLLGVERLRSYLDHLAKPFTFYTHVLSFLWRELATLGIVELGIFILHEHYADFSIEHEQVFADVHFMFFYTAIINAVLTILLHSLTIRYARRKWLAMEEVNINQYVLLRKNLRDARLLLEEVNPGLLKCYTESDEPSFWHSIKRFFMSFKSYSLAQKYTRLVEQRRFHELRVQLIEVNELPKKFPVAKYLFKCLQEVFLHQVHVHLLAWLLLMAFVEALYFGMGLVVSGCADQAEKKSYKYNDCDVVVGDTLVAVYIVSCIAAAILMMLAHNKMRGAFYHIMQ